MPTRNRGDRILPAVESALRQSSDEFKLILIDQSTDDSSAEALRRSGLAGARRLVYRRTTSVGISRARNEGLALSTADLVAFTDDDCIVPADWVQTYRDLFQALPETGLIFGPLVAAPTEATGWTPEFRPVKEGFVAFSEDVVQSLGLGANFAVRRSVIQAVGPFDPILGTGSVFGAGEDTDFAIRAMCQGYGVYTSRVPEVQHFGLRREAEIPQLRRRYIQGVVAMAMKHVRSGDPRLLRPILVMLAEALGEGTRNLLLRRRASGYRTVWWALQAVAASLRCPVDSSQRLYRLGREELSHTASGLADPGIRLASARELRTPGVRRRSRRRASPPQSTATNPDVA